MAVDSIVLELEADNNTRRGVRGAERDLDRLERSGGRSFRNLGKAALAAGTAVAAIGAAGFVALRQLAVDAANTNYEFNQMSDRIGTTVAQTEALAFAAGKAGTELQDLGDLIVDANERAQDALRGSEDAAAEFYEGAGISASAFLALDQVSQIEAVAQAFRDAEGDLNRQADLQRIFGTQTAQTQDALKSFEGGLDEYTQSLEESGLILDNETRAGLENFYDSLQEGEDNMTRFRNQLIRLFVVDAFPRYQRLMDNVVIPGMRTLSRVVTQVVLPAFRDLWRFISSNFIPTLQTLAGFMRRVLTPALGLVTAAYESLRSESDTFANFIDSTIVPKWNTFRDSITGVGDAIDDLLMKIGIGQQDLSGFEIDPGGVNRALRDLAVEQTGEQAGIPIPVVVNLPTDGLIDEDAFLTGFDIDVTQKVTEAFDEVNDNDFFAGLRDAWARAEMWWDENVSNDIPIPFRAALGIIAGAATTFFGVRFRDIIAAPFRFFRTVLQSDFVSEFIHAFRVFSEEGDSAFRAFGRALSDRIPFLRGFVGVIETIGDTLSFIFGNNEFNRDIPFVERLVALDDILFSINRNFPRVGAFFRIFGKLLGPVTLAIDLVVFAFQNWDSIVRPILDNLGESFGRLFGAIGRVVNSLGLDVGLGFILGIVIEALRVLNDLFEIALGGITTLIGVGLDFLITTLSSLVNLLSGDVANAFIDWQLFIDRTLEAFQNLGRWMDTKFGESLFFVASGLEEFFVRTVPNAVRTGINAMIGTVESGVNSVISAINRFINAWNSISFSIPRITIPRPDFLGGPIRFGGGSVGTPNIGNVASVSIPRLQSGGLITREGLAYLHRGEFLSRAANVDRGAMPPPSGDTFIFNFNGSVTDKNKFEQDLIRLIRKAKRTGALAGAV